MKVTQEIRVNSETAEHQYPQGRNQDRKWCTKLKPAVGKVRSRLWAEALFVCVVFIFRRAIEWSTLKLIVHIDIRMARIII